MCLCRILMLRVDFRCFYDKSTFKGQQFYTDIFAAKDELLKIASAAALPPDAEEHVGMAAKRGKPGATVHPGGVLGGAKPP